VAQVALPEAVRDDAASYVIHPALLDACCQVLAVLAPTPGAGHTELFVPVGLDELARFHDVPTDVWALVSVRPGGQMSHSVLTADIHLFDGAGQCVARLAGLRLARVTREALLGFVPTPVHAAATTSMPPLVHSLMAASPDERPVMLRAFIIERIATILGRANDQIDPAQPLNAIGFDSLMAGELSLDIEDAMGIIIPMERFRDVPTIDLITALLLEHLAASTSGQAQLPDAASTVDGMTDEEVERQLRARLASPGA
jgi:acyl carrier protein